MTIARALTPPSRREPGDIRGGDEVYLNHAGDRGELGRLALLCLSSSLGRSGPFTVVEVAEGRAFLRDGERDSTFSVSLSSLTRERPLSAKTINPFASLCMPELDMAIKL
jgi:hypothetical protein